MGKMFMVKSFSSILVFLGVIFGAAAASIKSSAHSLSNSSTESVARQGWGDLADTLLCQGQNAHGIRDALVSLLPNYSWFVLVQPTSGDWANSRDGAQRFMLVLIFVVRTCWSGGSL